MMLKRTELRLRPSGMKGQVPQFAVPGSRHQGVGIVGLEWAQQQALAFKGLQQLQVFHGAGARIAGFSEHYKVAGIGFARAIQG